MDRSGARIGKANDQRIESVRSKLRFVWTIAARCVLIQQARAWEGTVTTLISAIDASHYDLRITGAGSMCGIENAQLGLHGDNAGELSGKCSACDSHFFSSDGQLASIQLRP